MYYFKKDNLLGGIFYQVLYLTQESKYQKVSNTKITFGRIYFLQNSHFPLLQNKESKAVSLLEAAEIDLQVSPEAEDDAAKNGGEGNESNKQQDINHNQERRRCDVEMISLLPLRINCRVSDRL